MDCLTEKKFWDTYKPIESPGGSHAWEFEETLSYPVNRVWTIVSSGGEDNHSYAITGYHVVNREGYAVTEVPWVTGSEEGIWFEDDFDHEDDEDEDNDVDKD